MVGNEKSKRLKLILIISLCLNLLFLGSYAAVFLAFRALGTPQGRVDYASWYLKLTDVQKKELLFVNNMIQEYHRQNEQSQIEEMNELCLELSKNDPDYQKIDQLMGMLSDTRSKLLAFSSEQFQPFIKVLTLEQRQIIIKKIRKKQRDVAAE